MESIQAVYNVGDLIVANAQISGLRFMRTVNYPSEANLELLFDIATKILYQRSSPSGKGTLIFEFDNALAKVEIESGYFYASVYAESDKVAEEKLEMLTKKIPRLELKEDEISVDFWRLGQHGPISTSRKILCPGWPNIEKNYTQKTRDALERLFSNSLENSVGKLVLWHGEPGTGKTYALRSWARVCRDSLDIHYIVDPEVFFGESAAYMLSVLLGEEDNESNKWKLIVAEDTGELLTKDAKANTGQALARLLNVCDGLIGQGLKIIILITTNEALGDMHPAIVRPGRCLASISFEKLNEQEVQEWCEFHEVDLDSNSCTIADLYSKLDSQQIVARREKIVGFSKKG